MQRVLTSISRSSLDYVGTITCLALMVLLTFGAFAVADAQNDATQTQRLGYSIAVSGDYAVVGAEWEDGFKGAVYVYRRSGDNWVEVQRLSPGDLGPYDHFGGSVSMSGDVLVVGASWHGLLSGAAYVFERVGDQWVQRQKLTASDSEVESRFGHKVLVDDNGVMVTAGVGRNEAGRSDAGATYRFERSGGQWDEAAKLAGTQMLSEAAQSERSSEYEATTTAVLAAVEQARGDDGMPPLVSAGIPPAPGWVNATDSTEAPLETQVDVTWASVELDAIIYMVLRDSVLISIVSSDETKYSDTTAEIDSTYEYCVVVKNMEDLESAYVCDDIGGRIIFAPIDVSATDGELVDKVHITWTDVSTINTGYTIYQDVDSIGTTGPNQTWFDDTTAATGIPYQYGVVATVTGGYHSAAASDSGWLGEILPPKNVSATDGEYLDRVRITWVNQAPDTCSYLIYRADTLLAMTAVDAESYEDTTAQFGDTYTYCVATKGSGATGIPGAPLRRSAADATESIRVCDDGGRGLAPPGAVTASDAIYDDRIRVTWTDLCEVEDGYEISRALAPDTVVLDTTRAGVTRYDDFTAGADITYTYLVRAIHDLGGVSANSSDTGYRAIVLAPTDIEATDGEFEDHVDITWESSSTTAVLFKIYRDNTLIKSVYSGSRSYQDYGGTVGRNYHYAVAAATAMDMEAFGIPDEGLRVLKPPSAVVASDQTYEDRIVISWSDNSTLEHGYSITRLDSLNVTEIGAYNMPGRSRGIAITGDYAYVADLDTGLRVLDISNPNSLELVGSYDTPGTARGVAVAGRYAYVADEFFGLQVIDISNPNSLELAGSYDTPGDAQGVAVAGTYAYVADSDFGLQVIDISNPNSLDLAGSCDTPGSAFDVAVAGDYVYVADFGSGLSVIDVSTPENPVVAGSYDTPGFARDIAVDGRYAYVADTNLGLQIIDISTPEIPVFAANYDTPISGVALAGSYAIGIYTDSLYVIHVDIGDTTIVGPNQTSHADYEAVPGVTYTYTVSAFDSLGESLGYSATVEDLGGRVLLAPTNVRADKGISETQIEITWSDNSNAEDGYRVYRNDSLLLSTGDNFTSYVDHVDTLLLGQMISYHVEAFDSYGESAAASDTGYTTLLAPSSFHASDFYEDRIELTWVDRSGVEEGYEIYRDGSWLTTLTGSDLTSYTDLSDISVSFNNVSLIGAYDTPGNAISVAVEGHYAYVADGSSGLQVIDVSKPDSLAVAGEIDTPGSSKGIFVVGDYAYIADGSSGLQVIAVSNPDSLTVVGSLIPPGADVCGVVVIGDTAYVADGGAGLSVIDVSTRSNPQFKYSIDTPGYARGITVAGDYAYVADGNSGLQVIDISATWAVVGSVDTPGHALRVAVVGDYAYVADGASGLQVVNVKTPSSPVIAGSVDTPGTCRDVGIAGKYAYISDHGSGLQVVDISNPDSPVIVESYDTPGDAYGIDIAGNQAYIADYGSGLQVWTLHPYILPGETHEYHVQVYSGALTAKSNADSGVVYVPEPPEPAELQQLTQILTASDGGVGDFFGASVAIDGDRAVVGAHFENSYGGDRGAAYIFERNPDETWSQSAKLTPAVAANYDNFGVSVGISGERVIVGANNHYNDRGAVYVFERNYDGSWTQTEQLDGEDEDDQFGISVAISGDRAIVGAHYEDDSDNDIGSAYIFERNPDGSWSQKSKIRANTGVAFDYFGCSVAIDGDRAIVGSAANTYIFERNPNGTWPQTETQKLDAGTGGDPDYGPSVAINGDQAVVGSPGTAAYVFERASGGTWTQSQALTASDVTGSDFFGSAVAIDGDQIIVGAHYHGAKGAYSGAAYVFERIAGGEWIETDKLLAADGETEDLFGRSVAIGGGRGIIGQYDGVDAGYGFESPGSAYIVDLAASAYAVSATDGTPTSRVRVTWDDRSINEYGFRVYRDGEPIASLEPNVENYEDFDAEPGRTYEYSVATLRNEVSEELERVSDFGWRPANGNVTGRISTRGGAAAGNIKVAIDPLPTKALLFDGAGGYVHVPGDGGNLGFDPNAGFTVEAWFKYAGDGGGGAGDGTMIAKAAPGGGAQPYPFSLGNRRSAGQPQPGQLRFAMSDGTSIVFVDSDSTDFNDNSWHHVSCVHDASQQKLRLYVDGELQGTASSGGLGDITTTEPLLLGAGPDGSSWFGGQLDEVRVWSVVRDTAEIEDDRYHQLAGDEANLVAYWPLDEGSLDDDGIGSEGGNAAITDLAAGAHYGTFEGGVYWSDDTAPLDIYPLTDSDGNFVLRGIRYGTQATFKIRPFEGDRQFEPANRVVTLTTEDPVENQLEFTDISSFTVSGIVRYDTTNCGATDVTILVDGQPTGLTDKNGKFAVSVEYLGSVSRSIRPWLDGHTFVPDSLTLVVDHDTLLADTTGVAFFDMTTRTLSGRVGGGCGNSIGDVVITIRSENNCLLESITTADSVYSISLPPQTYLVTAAVVEDSIPPGLNRPDVVKFFQTLGERRVELTNGDVTLDFVYRAPLQVAITGMETYTVCDTLTYQDRVLPANLPVIPQGEEIILTIEVEEDYDTVGTCALDSGTVTIYDELSDRESTLKIVNGEAVYRTYASAPSLLIGRTDDQGNDRSFQKSIRAVVSVEGRSPAEATEWALVTGHVAPEGADFVTFTTEPMPFHILRDPPGDNSYAFLDKGYTLSTTINFDIGSVTAMQDNKRSKIDDLRFGFSGSTGFGFGLDIDVAVLAERLQKVTFVEVIDSTGATVVTTTIDERFATASHDLSVGEPGDLLIGAGLNYVFKEVGVVEVEGCEVVPSKSIGVEPTGFATTFAYTERHISDVLIPELQSKVDYYAGQGDSDSAAVFLEMVDSWTNMLAANDSLKWNAIVTENRSFSAGAEYMYSFTSDTTETFRKTTTLFKDEEKQDGTYINLGFPVQFEYLVVHIDRSHKVSALVDTTQTSTTTVGYVLSDDDVGDHFTVDIKQDGRYPSPVFDVRAGTSSCPYEPWPDPSGSAQMLARDNPTLKIVPASRDSVQPDEAAAFTLELYNKSETEESRLYALRLLTASNPHGAIVKVAGETIMNGLQQYFIDPAPNNRQEATLTVERGPTAYDYDSLAVILYPPCEYALWEDGGPLQQSDTLYFSVSFEDQGPMVFGTPEPADEELSFGEDISVTFTEAIDCESIRPDSLSITYVDGPNAGSMITHDVECNSKTIILEPTADPNDLEGRRLRARVSTIRDRNGNAMTGDVTWEFEYRASRFTWSELQVSSNISYRRPEAITAELVNGTDEVIDFTIADKPDTIAVEPASGTILPGGRQTVSLIPDSDLEKGDYQFQIEAQAADPSQGIAVLDVYLNVTCNDPVWVVQPYSYQHSMTITAQLDIDSVLSADENDKVAAFVGNQLRGVANIDSVGGLPQPYIAFLTVYSNRPQSETVRFQVWDDSDCKLYNSTLESYPFVANADHGSPVAPVTLTATEIAADSTLTIDVAGGWTWISTNIRSSDMSVNTVLSDLTPMPGDLIKAHAPVYSQFVDDSTGWSGTLNGVDNLSGYMIKLSEPGTIVHEGEPFDTLIPVVQEWNWISYLPQGPFTVGEALADLDGQGLVTDGDRIKSQDAFAEFYGTSWYGNLDAMEPGKGYKLYLANASAVWGDDSFAYPVYSQSESPPLLAAGDDSGETPSEVENAPSWSVNPHAYQHNMTVTAVLRIGGAESIDENDMVGAFVGDDCRGVARPVYVDGVRRHELFLVVCGDKAGGETVNLRAFDAGDGVVYDVAQTLTFEADKVEGQVREPVVFTADAVWGGGEQDMPSVYALGQNYPNPFNPTTAIGYDVPAGGGHITLRIYDVAGRLVRTLVDGTETPGRKVATWDGSSNNGQQVATGVYFYRMTAPGFEQTRKMVLMK